jgi:hypothetical protein
MSSIERPAHILKPEKSLAMPRHLLFVDTETTQYIKPNGDIEQKLRLGWACYWRRASGRHLDKETWRYFTSSSQFWQFVFSLTGPKIKLWVIARNITFDFTVCSGWQFLKKEGYKLKFFHNAGTTTIISVRKGRSSIVFLDSMNWFVESLEKTGSRIGLPKMTIDFKTCSENELKEYCRNDVKIELENFRLFIRFLETNRIARLCYTRGSTAMSAYLLRHYNTKIYIHNNKEAIDLERDSYKGGRTECFYIGDLSNAKHYTLDVNSLYPFVMRNNSYPVKYESICHTPDIPALCKTLQTKAIVAKCLIETDEPIYAVRRKRTVFPTGVFITTLCTPELKYALAFGHVKKVLSMVVYEQADIFRSYVDKLYKLRLQFRSEGIAEYEEICKKMLNSLYGKFGQKADEWALIGKCPDEPDREELVFNVGGKRVTKLRYLMGELWELSGQYESFDSFPAIAAHVTAYARLYLWGLMQKAGQGNYFYCDTDSLIVNNEGLKRLNSVINADNLGALKLEKTHTLLIINGLKDYITDEKRVIKGIRKSAVEIQPRVFQQELWPSFKGLLRWGETDTYTVTHITKTLSREYTKGIVTESGFVIPHVFSVDDDVLL